MTNWLNPNPFNPIRLTDYKLSNQQRAALLFIAEHGGSVVDKNAWTTANSLVRKGLATKVPTTEEWTKQPEVPHVFGGKSLWYRELRKPRARYTLTKLGHAVADRLREEDHS